MSKYGANGKVPMAPLLTLDPELGGGPRADPLWTVGSAEVERPDHIEPAENAENGQQGAHDRRRDQPRPAPGETDVRQTERSPQQALDQEPRFVQQEVLEV